MPSLHPLTILTAADVDRVLSRLDLPRAIASQAAVFDAFTAASSAASAASAATTGTPAYPPTIPNIQNPHRSTIESDSATSLFMPARIADLGATTCKIVSVPKASSGAASGGDGGGRAQEGLPAVTVVLDDAGRVKGLVNARRLTAMRNACGSALFLQRFPAPRKPATCVIFGSGEQAFAHASVLLRLYNSIQQCIFVVRRETERAIRMIDQMKRDHAHVDCAQCIAPGSPSGSAADQIGTAELRQYIEKADIIITATPSTQALFPSAWVQPHTRLVLIGSYKPHMREVEDELIRRVGTVVVDSKKACLQEAGELISAGLKEDELVELGDRTDGATSSRVGGREDIVIFKSVGLGVQDVAIAKLVLDLAEAEGLGTRIEAFD